MPLFKATSKEQVQHITNKKNVLKHNSTNSKTRAFFANYKVT